MKSAPYTFHPLRRLALCLCAAALLAWPAQARAGVFLTAKELSQACMSDAQTNTYYCLGYIAGVIDYHIMMQSLGTAPTIDFCLPDTVTVQQAAVVVLSFLRKAPEHGDFIAAPAIPMALHNSYPCAAPKPKKRRR